MTNQTKETEFTLQTFRQNAWYGFTTNSRDFLSGPRAVNGLTIKWRSKAGIKEMPCEDSLDAAPDQIAELFRELNKNCIIRDCLIPPSSN